MSIRSVWGCKEKNQSLGLAAKGIINYMGRNIRQNEVNSSDLKMRAVLGYLRAINVEQTEGLMK